MSLNKRKSSHGDAVEYSDSDDYARKEDHRPSKTHKNKRRTPKESVDDLIKKSKKKSSKRDTPEYSDENLAKEGHKLSKKQRREKRDRQEINGHSAYQNAKKNYDKEERRKKQEDRAQSLYDSEDSRDLPEEKRSYSRRLSDDRAKDRRIEKQSYRPRLSDEEHAEKQKKKSSYTQRLREDSGSHRKDKRTNSFSDEEIPKERRKEKNNYNQSILLDDDLGELRKEKRGYVQRLTEDKNREDSRKEKRSCTQRLSDEESRPQYDAPDRRKKKRYDRDIESSPNQQSSERTNETKKVDEIEPLSKRQKIGNINMRTGGAYIPPARLRMMQEQIKDKASEEYQRIAWEALKKSIVGMTNKINGSNITEIVPELFKENIIRGRGILARAIMQAQAASPTFTRVYAALVAIINTKFPEIGELILKRLIIQYKRGFRRNDKTICMTAARFLAHLLNQEVAHEILVLEMVTHLLENPTEDSIEVAIACLKECGKKLTQLTARGMRAITQRVRDVLHEGNVDVRVRYMIEVFFAIQKDGFKDFEVIPQELDLVEEDDKYTHLINLDDAVEAQEMLNIFKFDPDYVENEEKYKSVVKEILGDESDEEGSGNESESEGEEEGEEAKTEENQQIIDMTETNIVCLRRKIYLTVQSSLDFEECAHKLLKLELKPGQILEMCYMILDCCAQQRTYEKFFGLLAQRFCQLSKVYVEPFTEIFENSYKTIHRLETNKLRNVAKFFAHLLYTDAISWMVLANIKLNEEDTTSSSRIFIKILFQELCEYMGLPKLNERVKDITLQAAFEGLFPRDHPHNTRFAINFFTSIGLGGLTDELREHLKNLPKNPIPVAQKEESPQEVSSPSSSSSSSNSSSSSSSSSSSESDERSSKRKKQQKKQKVNVAKGRKK